MSIGAIGSIASSTYRIINHVTVHSSDVLSGLIGGVVVLLGVVLTEAFVRVRERRRRLDEAAWGLQTATRGGLLTGRPLSMSIVDLLNRYQEIMQQLGRIRTDAKWPIHDAKKIRAEVDAVIIRFMVAIVQYGTEETTGPPPLGPILDSKLLPLIFRDAASSQSLDDALERAGLPSLADAISHNAQAENARS